MEDHDEAQEDIDMESEAYQQLLEAERWHKDVRAVETNLLKEWFEWCKSSDQALRPRKN